MTSLFEQTETSVVVMNFAEMQDENAGQDNAAQASEQAQQELAAQLTAQRDAQWEARLAEERDRASEQAREECEEHFRQSLEIERSAIALSCTGFAKARERYFVDIEREVVQLALAIAARILQREVIMDPVLLAGVVRVALDKLSDPEGASLHVPADSTEVWRKAMKSSGLHVEADATLKPGELQLKTTAGIAEFGIEAQIVEIERGFFDLLAKRPA